MNRLALASALALIASLPIFPWPRGLQADRIPVRITPQMFTVGSVVPNIRVDLTDSSGVSMFSQITYIGAICETLTYGNQYVSCSAGIDSIDGSFRWIDMDVAQLDGLVAPPGTKVWIVVEGVGR